MISPLKIVNCVKAARLFSLPCSIFPIIVGFLFSELRLDSRKLVILFFISTAVILIHVASNLFNTYYDFKNGVFILSNILLIFYVLAVLILIV